MGGGRFFWLYFSVKTGFLLCAGLLLTLLFCTAPAAQEGLGIFPGIRPPEILPQFPEKKPPAMEAPVLPAPLSPVPPAGPGQLSVLVREIRVEGNTVLPQADILKVTSGYINRELTSADMEQLRRALTLLYIDKGYINSGAVLPDQKITGGIVTYRIIEGRLSDVEIEGNKWLRTSYYKARIPSGEQEPLNVNSLLQSLQLLQQDERISKLQGELRPGIRPGESELKLKVEEAAPYKIQLGFNNYQSPTVGAERGFVTATLLSLTGVGDMLSATYGGSEGQNPLLDFSYSLPLSSNDTTLFLRYRKNDFNVVEEPFAALDIKSKSDISEITLRHPVYRTPTQEFALALTGEHLRDETFLLGEPFSFSPGAHDGKSVVTALRLAQEWTYRTQHDVMAARSRFSLGIDALGATMNEKGLPDGHFFAWLGQFQWARIWDAVDIQTIFRTDLQLAGDPLLVLEQIPVGGRYSVRGYRENELVRDNALISSIELRVPLVREKSWADYVQLAPFIDYGKAWNTNFPTPDPDYLLSVGLGLRWGLAFLKKPVPVKSEFEIYWGFRLKDVSTTGDNLQDQGIHMQFTLSGF